MSFCKSPFVRHLHSATFIAVIDQLSQLFEERGVPEVVYSDNGLQYTSDVSPKNITLNISHHHPTVFNPTDLLRGWGGSMQKVVDESQRIRHILSPSDDSLQRSAYLILSQIAKRITKWSTYENTRCLQTATRRRTLSVLLTAKDLLNSMTD